MKRLFLIAFLAGVPVASGAEETLYYDWQGIWAYEPAWCENADRIGSVTPAPIAITETEVLGYENSCEIQAVDVLPDLQAVRLRLSCESEGAVFEEGRLLMLAHDDELWMWDGGGEPLRFHRCADAGQ